MSDTTASTTSRMPNPMIRVPALGAIGRELAQVANSGAVPAITISLAHLRVGQLVGSEYLVALHTGNLRRAGEADDRIDAVASWRDSDLFTLQETVALGLAEALLMTDRPGDDRVSDELYTLAISAFDETELTTLVIALGQVFFYVPLALIGKPVPGAALADQWRP